MNARAKTARASCFVAVARALLLGAALLLPTLPLQAQPANQSPSLQPPALRTSDPFQANRVLPVDTAFALSTRMDDGALLLDWEIHEGHYLYRKSIEVLRADGSPVRPLALPSARTVTDEFFGESAVYFDRLTLEIPLATLRAEGDTLQLELRYQGCAEDLYCYPPTRKSLALPLP